MGAARLDQKDLILPVVFVPWDHSARQDLLRKEQKMLRTVGLRTDLQHEITAGRSYFAGTPSAKFTLVVLQNDSFSASLRTNGLGRDALSKQQNHNEQLESIGPGDSPQAADYIDRFCDWKLHICEYVA